MKTTIQVSKELQRRLKILAAFMNTNYENALDEIFTRYENSVNLKTDRIIKNMRVKR